MDTIDKDWRLFGKTSAIYSDAAQDILSILDSAATSKKTLTDDQRSLDSLLLSAVGFSQTGINLIGRNESNIVESPLQLGRLDPDYSTAEQVLADVYLLVPGRAAVRGPRAAETRWAATAIR